MKKIFKLFILTKKIRFAILFVFLFLVFAGILALSTKDPQAGKATASTKKLKKKDTTLNLKPTENLRVWEHNPFTQSDTMQDYLKIHDTRSLRDHSLLVPIPEKTEEELQKEKELEEEKKKKDAKKGPDRGDRQRKFFKPVKVNRSYAQPSQKEEDEKAKAKPKVTENPTKTQEDEDILIEKPVKKSGIVLEDTWKTNEGYRAKINGQTVKTGDEIGQYRISYISKKRVLLETETGKTKTLYVRK